MMHNIASPLRRGRCWRKPSLNPPLVIGLACLLLLALPSLAPHLPTWISPACDSQCYAQAEPAAQPPAASETPAAPKIFVEPPAELLVSNVFFETDIKQALSDVATQTATTILADETVTGFVTLDLQGVSLERALRLMLMPGGFIFEQVEAGVYLVTSPKPDSPGFAEIAKSQVVELNYIASDDLASLLPGLYSPFVKFDKLGNRVIVTAPPNLLQATVNVIKMLDTPPLQIMIEALVIETSRRALQNFELSLQGEHLGLQTSTSMVTYVGQAEQLLHQLIMMVGTDKATIRANPRVVAQEGKEANVKVAVEQYFQIISGRVGWEYVQLEPIEAAIGLSITPRVAKEDKMVTCTIKPEVGDVTGVTGSNLPIITKRTAESTVRIADGEVIAIGGLLQDVRRETKRKIPLLGDLPLIGPLFRNTTTDNDTREVVIFIVPHILDQSGRFTGPLLLDRVSEGQLGALDAGMVVPEQETRAEAERRRELIRERVRQREAATQPPS